MKIDMKALQDALASSQADINNGILAMNPKIAVIHAAARAYLTLAPVSVKLRDDLVILEAQIESFYVATMTNAKGRDDNKAMKKAALATVRSALTRYAALTDGGKL